MSRYDVKTVPLTTDWQYLFDIDPRERVKIDRCFLSNYSTTAGAVELVATGGGADQTLYKASVASGSRTVLTSAALGSGDLSALNGVTSGNLTWTFGLGRDEGVDVSIGSNADVSTGSRLATALQAGFRALSDAEGVDMSAVTVAWNSNKLVFTFPSATGTHPKFGLDSLVTSSHATATAARLGFGSGEGSVSIGFSTTVDVPLATGLVLSGGDSIIGRCDGSHRVAAFFSYNQAFNSTG